MADVIELRGLRVVGCHGVLEHEKSNKQPFEIDLILSVDTRAASKTDNLADTVDYGAVALRVVGVVEDESHQLLERLAERIANEVMTFNLVQAVEVTLTKLRPPVPVDLAAAAVRINRP